MTSFSEECICDVWVKLCNIDYFGKPFFKGILFLFHFVVKLMLLYSCNLTSLLVHFNVWLHRFVIPAALHSESLALSSIIVCCPCTVSRVYVLLLFYVAGPHNFCLITGTLSLLSAPKNCDDYRIHVLKSSEKLGRTLNEAAIRSLVERLKQKNDANMYEFLEPVLRYFSCSLFIPWRNCL